MSIGLASLQDARIAALSTADIFALRDLGRTRHRVDWALDVLAASLPWADWETLCALPLGRRDGLLLALRGKCFGRTLALFADCPSCGERLEFSMDVADLIVADPFAPLPATGTALGSLAVADGLAEALSARSADEDRCEVLSAALRARVPPGVPAAQGAALLENDPMVILSFPMICPACRHGWSPLLDVVGTLWSDVAAECQRALADVHSLAQAYGWTEDQILALSPDRRQAYIDLIHRQSHG